MPSFAQTFVYFVTLISSSIVWLNHRQIISNRNIPNNQKIEHIHCGANENYFLKRIIIKTIEILSENVWIVS